MKTSTSQSASPTASSRRDAENLILWYLSVKRDLPWRKNRDPYRIWVSEVMLQQTTVAAVIPFFEKFMKRFPTLASLAKAPEEDVIEHWAGLGYYSRARNLHRAAQDLVKTGFPKTHQELLSYPGFGPYTARAVSSLAFDEKTGVLDGNVIRVLSRRHGLKLEWWKPQARAQLQVIADQLAQVDSPSALNQGLMELGATVCTPTSPKCGVCPWTKHCVAKKNDLINELPLKKPRRDREIWLWKPVIVESKGAVLLVENTYAPFLKGHWILPGSAHQLDNAPELFDYKGCVTHHDIFVSVNVAKSFNTKMSNSNSSKSKWVAIKNLAKEVPASLIRKAIAERVNT